MLDDAIEIIEQAKKEHEELLFQRSEKTMKVKELLELLYDKNQAIVIVSNKTFFNNPQKAVETNLVKDERFGNAYDVNNEYRFKKYINHEVVAIELGAHSYEEPCLYILINKNEKPEKRSNEIESIFNEAINLEVEIKENRLQLAKEKYRNLDSAKLDNVIQSKSVKHDRVVKALRLAKKNEKLLNLYKKARKQFEEYVDTPNKISKILHLALDVEDILDEIDKLEKEGLEL